MDCAKTHCTTFVVLRVFVLFVLNVVRAGETYFVIPAPTGQCTSIAPLTFRPRLNSKISGIPNTHNTAIIRKLLTNPITVACATIS